MSIYSFVITVDTHLSSDDLTAEDLAGYLAMRIEGQKLVTISNISGIATNAGE